MALYCLKSQYYKKNSKEILLMAMSILLGWREPKKGLNQLRYIRSQK